MSLVTDHEKDRHAERIVLANPGLTSEEVNVPKNVKDGT
jgi:hypothetical protein